MELKGIKNKTSLIGLEKPEISGFSEEGILDIVGQERITSLKKAISEINKLIDERKKLSLEFIKEGENIKSEISNLILENERR